MERKITRPGECSETVSLDEFRKRLGQTIDFVQKNQRPNWEAVVAEQTKREYVDNAN
jgi:O-acetylhomoserine/O-acetylserine sulfhydrylase-like pyridoxal-dependent enzyme